MGKGAEDEQAVLPIGTADGARSTSRSNAGADGCCCSCLRFGNLRGLIKGRCVFALLLGLAVFLSAVFWLPFFHNGDGKDPDLYSEFAGHDIVASFMLEKPIPFLNDHILHLEDDIFDEMSFSSTKVVILSLEPTPGSNITKVVFAVDSDVKGARISTAVQSLIKQLFDSLVTRQAPLSLTASLFGEPFSFDVLKFKGGITISPSQSAFLFQTEQIYFNFTLNFSVDQILVNFDELRTQLNLGLHLASYENLYIALTNLKGSTIAPPTIVQTRVVLAVGINTSMSRGKQLAHTITDPHTKNLGLNNTVFGRVKQVRLSSLPHTLAGDGPSPAPSPLPHHHRHHHHHSAIHTPAIPPAPQTEKGGPASGKVLPSAPVLAPAPAPWKSHVANPPGCHYKTRYPRKKNKHYHIPPTMPPIFAPRVAPSAQPNIHSPPPSVHQAPSSSSLPHVVLSHVQPPSESRSPAEPPDVAPSVSAASSCDLASIMFAALLFFTFNVALIEPQDLKHIVH